MGRTIRGRSRSDEHRAVLAEIAGLAASHEVDLVVVAGDLFDLASPSAESERIVYRALLDLAAVAPVVMVAGNHDHPRRLQAVAPLLDLGRVTVGATLERPDQGGVVTVSTASGETARVVLLPFIGQRAIIGADQLMALDPDEHGGRYAGRLQSVIARLTEESTPDQVNLVVAHLMVHGGVLGGGERSAHTIFDYSVPAQAFPGHLSYVALGHLHRQQRIPAAPPVWYCGSPLQLDFGETQDDKAVLVVEVQPGLPAEVTPVDLHAGRRLRKLSGTLEEVAALAGTTGAAFLRVELQEAARIGLAEQVRELFPEAVDVVLVGPRRDQGPEPPPIRLGRPPRELFAEYLRHRQVEDERLIELFDELLAEAHEA